MRILSLNVNGLKAFYNRGEGDGYLLQDLIDNYDPDIIIFNETKCSNEDYKYWLSEWKDDWKLISARNQYNKGYAGVGMMVNNRVIDRFPTMDTDICPPVMTDSKYDTGRILKLDFPDFYIIGVYVLNSGEKDEQRQLWDKEFHEYLRILQIDKPILVLGDMNVCSYSDDCWAFDQYFDSMPGVKSYEIDSFHLMLDQNNLIDSFRKCHPDDRHTYSWFSYRGASRYKNQGFRLDYALVDKRLEDKIIDSSILGKACQYSDHSPILLEIDI